MIHTLYLIVIQPLVTFLEFLFHFFYYEHLVMGLVTAIGAMSISVSLLCLPFYLKAEKINEEEKKLQAKMADRVECIKKNFKGDEKYFLLQTCYRQNNYHPIMSLRLSLSLLLQIPFFIAAYTFFSHLILLDGVSFCGIENLAKPDNLLSIGAFHVNLLPIIMTVVNLVAGFVYTGNLKFKDNKVLIIMSLVFLVLLYNSPAALVIYWTFNNVFSLIKNVCLRYFNEQELFLFLASLILVLHGLYSIRNYLYFNPEFFVLFFVFFIVKFKLLQKIKIPFEFIPNKLFYCGIFLLFILTGLFIPSSVISSSPTEFFIGEEKTALSIIYNSFFVFFGLFVFWGTCVYYVLQKEEKKVFAFLCSILSIIALINIFYWKLPDTPLLNDLTFSLTDIMFYLGSFKDYFWYCLILLAVFFTIYFCIKYKKSTMLYHSFSIIIFSLLVLSGNNLYKIQKTIANYKNIPQAEQPQLKLINLSKTKKNVVIIFLDRAINSFFPLIVAERPELKEQFRGFDYYPNTLCFAKFTVFGYMPMLGGYEYIPQHLDERKIDFLIKFNEAVTMLPALFSLNNYPTRIIHPVNNSWDEEDSFNKGSKGIVYNDLYKKYNIETIFPPKFIYRNMRKSAQQLKNTSQRNMLFFSIMQILPIRAKKYIYNNGKYHAIKGQREKGEVFYSSSAIQYYNELEKLSDLTEFNAKTNTFTIYNNWLTHSPSFLQYPEYKLDYKNPVKKSDLVFIHDFNEVSLKHYHVNAAALIFVGKWLDTLKKEGVYDNTRIIIVADHGYPVKNKYVDAFLNKFYLFYNPLLLVKDFNSKHELNMNHEEFMTNADTVFFATKDIIKKPKNPFSGKYLSDKEKETGFYIRETGGWEPKLYVDKDYVHDENDVFYFVKGNPKKKENWRENIKFKDMKKELNQE
ncbi:MAG: YidC/Oxa1 family membrane protein insertase [bacterium]|nr:YidC/Oxa1 family membrane protein insertase [bacterium]